MKMQIHIIFTLLQWIYSTIGNPISAKVDKFVENVLECRKIPALQLVVVKNGEIVHAKGYGYKDEAKKKKVTENTVFCIGSLTKAFTATVAVDALKRHGLTLDTPLKQILGPRLRLSSAYVTDHVTMRDVLSHRVGVPGYFGGLLVGMDATRDDAVRRLEFMPSTARLAEKYLYNNFMYLLASATTKQLTKKTWEKLVRERIFKPLNMTKSTFIENLMEYWRDERKDGEWDDFADSYFSVNGTVRIIPRDVLSMVRPDGPAGSICSSGLDMARWLRWNLNLPSNMTDLHEPQILTPVKKHAMTRPHSPVDEFRYAYNLGWGTGIYRGYETIRHGGLVSGYRSAITLVPSANLGIYIILNGPNSPVADVAHRAVKLFTTDLFLGLEPWLNHSTGCAFPYPFHKPYLTKLMSVESAEPVKVHEFGNGKFWGRELKDFEGVYYHLAFGNVTIKINESDGSLRIRHGRMGRGVLYPQTEKFVFRIMFTGILEYVTIEDAENSVMYKLKFYEENGHGINSLTTGYLVNTVRFYRNLNSENLEKLKYGSTCSAVECIALSRVVLMLLVLSYCMLT